MARTKISPEQRELDFQLMQRIAAKDGDALAEFSNRFYPLIYSTAYKVLRHAEDTEDVSAEVLNTVLEEGGFLPSSERFTCDLDLHHGSKPRH